MRKEFQSNGLWSRVLRKLSKRQAPADAEDALQSAYLRLLSRSDEGGTEKAKIENPEAYLARVASNITIDTHRRKAFESDRPFEQVFANIADTAPLQDEVIEARIRLRYVEQGLAQLSPRTREVFLMHRIDGYKYREIADRLNISQSAVEKHIAKAVLFLAQWMRAR